MHKRYIMCFERRAIDCELNFSESTTAKGLILADEIPALTLSWVWHAHIAGS